VNILVNADDFGIHNTSTFAILECFSRGWLDRATAMMNMSECKEAEELAHENRLESRVGLHINLTWGKPMTDEIKRLPLFCDKEGSFNGRFHKQITSRLWIPTAAKYCVAQEIRAQVYAFRKSRFSCLHADSHHHVHMDLSILPIVIAVLKEGGFKSVRIGRNIGLGMSHLNRLYKSFANNVVDKSKMDHSDYFGSPFDAIASRKSIMSGSQVELMVHPTFRLKGERNMKGKLCDFMRSISDAEDAIRMLRRQ